MAGFGFRALRAAVLLLPLLAGAETVGDRTAIRDPDLAETSQFQDPRSVTTFFPSDREKRPDWVDVLRRGLIAPRETLRGGPRPPEAMGEVPKAGILFTNTRQMPHVLFPHSPHTEWLACSNCHDGLFERRATGRGFGMQAILDGKHCGTCHGRVAFSPEGSCYRCHSQPNVAGLIQTPPADGAKAQEDVEAAAESDDAPRRRRSGQTVRGSSRSPVYSR